jgi:hypothetical protein
VTKYNRKQATSGLLKSEERAEGGIHYPGERKIGLVSVYIENELNRGYMTSQGEELLPV